MAHRCFQSRSTSTTGGFRNNVSLSWLTRTVSTSGTISRVSLLRWCILYTRDPRELLDHQCLSSAMNWETSRCLIFCPLVIKYSNEKQAFPISNVAMSITSTQDVLTEDSINVASLFQNHWLLLVETHGGKEDSYRRIVSCFGGGYRIGSLNG